MRFAAEHGGDMLRAKLLGDWEEVVVQVPAAVNQRLVAGKPDGQLDSNPAACGCHHRPGDLSDMREKTARRSWLAVPALSQLASWGATFSRTAAAGRRKIMAMPVIVTVIRIQRNIGPRANRGYERLAACDVRRRSAAGRPPIWKLGHGPRPHAEPRARRPRFSPHLVSVHLAGRPRMEADPVNAAG